MKTVFAIVATLTLFFNFYASASSIYENCSNASGTITINHASSLSVLTIVTGKYNSEGQPEVQSIKFDLRQNDIQLRIIESLTIHVDGSGSYTDTTSVRQINIRKTNGEKMPDAYSKNVDADGSLSDFLICTNSRSWR